MTRGWIGQKRRYRRYRARAKQLPASYQTAIGALERYLLLFGPGTTDGVLPMLEDLAYLFEQSAASGTAIRDVVGSDPVEFVEVFLRNYPESQWIGREQKRLITAVDRAVDIERS